MQGSIGIQTRIGTILPGASRIAKIVKLSKEARIRLKWIDYYRSKGNARATCRHFDIVPSLFYKWYNRYRRIGIRGLEDSSRRPQKFRVSKVPVEYIDLIKILRKRYPYFSKYKIEIILKRDYDIALSNSTIGRAIKKHDLFFASPYHSKKNRQKHVRNRLPKEFKLAQPGDLVQSDTKHISFFGPKRYFYVIADCLTKMVSIHVSSSISSKQSRIAFERAGKHIPYRIKNSQNDNGSENLLELSKYLQKNNINQYFTRPRTPKDNSFVERMIGTIEREFIQQGKLTFDVAGLQTAVDEWLNEYHNFRPHQSLGYLTPNEYYAKIKQEKCSRCIEP
jgi:transposase InsO family protein/transposase-like protein